ANNRVAFKLQEYTEQGLTNIELRSAFREHFACWGDRSFKLLSTPVKTELREFLLKREVDIEKGLGIQIVNALLKVIKTQTKEEEQWIEAETTTPEGEPGAQYLSRRNVQTSPVDVSMADASYRQVSTRDIQMIDAPIPLRPNTSATINHPATRRHEDLDVTMISAPELPQQVQQSP
ncbi:hypothetical protein E4U61_007521, partial [Claviceps capensis]